MSRDDASYDAAIARARLALYQRRVADSIANDPLDHMCRVSQGLKIKGSEAPARQGGSPMTPPTDAPDASFGAPDHEAHKSPWIESWWFLTTFVVIAILLIAIAETR